MIKYIITSPAHEGEATLTYNEGGECPNFDCFNTNMRPHQHEWMMYWILKNALTEDKLNASLAGASQNFNIKFKKVTFEPTFADFWAAYFKNRYKDNSSKKTSEKRWNSMSKGAQLAAFNYVPNYFLQIPSGTQPKLAETYLSSEVWVR
jgi:hypothetical protein